MTVHLRGTNGLGQATRIGTLPPNPYQRPIPGKQGHNREFRRQGQPADLGAAFTPDRTDLPCQQPGRPGWWFAPEQEPGMPELTEKEAAEAQELCGTCPLELDCRLFALQTGQGWGIWGGVRFAHMDGASRSALLKATERELRRRTA